MPAFRPSTGSRPRPRSRSRRRLLIATAAVGAALALTAPAASAADFSEDFDPGVAAGQPWTPAGWSQSNQSSPLGTTSWFQGSTLASGGPFEAHQGVPSSYIAANFNSTVGGTGTISNWLISPKITTLTNGDIVSFYTRSAGSAYPDRLELRLSSDGTCTPGPGATAVGSFSILLASVNPTLAPAGYPVSWTQYTATVSGLPASTAVSGCLGFRYWVTGAGPVGSNSDYIGIDSFRFVEDVVAPAAPTVSSVTPTSPGSDNAPKATGAAEAGSTVRIYGDSACTGTVLGTGTATAFNGGAGVAFTVADDATVTPYATATDDSGNVSDCSAAGPTYVEDSIAPVTADDVPTGWQTATPAVTLTATDINGVAHTYYEVGTSPAVPTAASPVYDPAHKPTLGNGQKIRYFSVDTAGNAETPRSSTVAQVDLDPPVTTDDVPGGWVGAAPAVTLDASDPDGSGVAHTYYEVGVNPAVPTSASSEYDPAYKPTLGNGQRIRYFSVDAVGHAETPRSSGAAKVDLAAPVTGDDVAGGWVGAAPAVTLDASDPDGSGVAHTYYEVGASPAPPTTASSEYDPAHKPTLANGQRIRYFSVDAVGNAEAPRSSGVAKVDLAAPVTGDDVPTGWVGAAPAVTLDASDPDGSGVAHTYYEVGVNPALPTTASSEYDPAHKPTLSHGQRIRYFSVDAVGNAEAPRSSGAAKVDLVAPATSDDVTAATAPGASVVLTASDADSGVAATYYTVGVDPAVPTTAGPAYDPAHRPVLAAGERIRYFSVDAAGNAEQPRSSVAVSIPPAPVPPVAGPQPAPRPQSDGAPKASRSPLRVTQVASDARCLGNVRGARREITVRYATTETTKLTLSLQRRVTRNSPAAPTGCPAAAPEGAGPDSRGGKAIVYATVTAGASPRAVRGARELTLVRTVEAGKQTLPLLRTFRLQRLAPGRYRLRIQPTNADGTAGRTSYVHFWALAARK